MWKGTFLVFLLCALAPAQAKSSKTKKNTPDLPPPIFEIKLAEDSDLGSMPWAKDWPTPPQGDCIGDGNLYVWRWPPGQGLVGFTPGGIVSFASDKMSDIPMPYAHGGSVSQSAVYLAVDGTENPRQETETVQDADGHELKLHKTEGENRRYIARFDRDGTYKAAIKLDLPFYVSTFAGFDSGAFVAQGLDENKIPRVALLDASWQLIRYLDLRKDMSAVSEIPGKDLKIGGTQADAGSIVMTSGFTPSNGKILFLRSLASRQVYEIQESGQVRVVTIKAPDGYDVEGFIATDRNWLVEFRKPSSNGVWSEATHFFFEVDPQNGKLQREYRISPPDTGISCFFNGEFWGVRYKDGKLDVGRGRAEPYRAKAAVSRPTTGQQ